MRIFISKKVESLNVMLKLHWSKRYKLRNEWEREIWALFNGKVPRSNCKMDIKITSCRKKMIDQDNFVGGCKPILDSMKKLGLIVDDSAAWVKVEYEQLINESGLKDFKIGTSIEIIEMGAAYE